MLPVRPDSVFSKKGLCICPLVDLSYYPFQWQFCGASYQVLKLLTCIRLQTFRLKICLGLSTCMNFHFLICLSNIPYSFTEHNIFKAQDELPEHSTWFFCWTSICVLEYIIMYSYACKLDDVIYNNDYWLIVAIEP